MRESTPEALAGRMRSIGILMESASSRSKRFLEEELGRKPPASLEPIHAEACFAFCTPCAVAVEEMGAGGHGG